MRSRWFRRGSMDHIQSERIQGPIQEVQQEVEAVSTP